MTTLSRRHVPGRVLRNLHDRIRKPHSLSRAGQTPFDVIAEDEIVSLRHYPPTGPARADRQPIVIVPPLAVNMLIYDLFPERSLVAFLRDLGHPLYLIDWGRPTRQQSDYRLATYLTRFMPAMLNRVRAHSGQQRLTLHGWSIGAMLSYAYAALGDPDIERLVLVGPPCDYHAKGMQNRRLAAPLKALQNTTGWGVHRSPQVLWHVPGWANALGFKLMSPGTTLRGYTQLLRRLDDRDFVAAHATNAAFLDDMVAYPGGVMQDIVQFLVTDNVLAHGRLPIRGCQARLADIRAKVLMVIGDKDPIITPLASRRLIELMDHADCEMIEVPGGHVSIVSGSNAPTEIWPRIAAWLASD
ncbi:alpha/beta fold hydrolase [Sinimarinibacterium sp. CAU 1509]|uniref:alpha/beta fold hydrolase n=1 Tax=Sinimarinibacterium sp. CAU 1509 TaxID=2562283 RepID=UPI0010AD6153|nr:alpha/beta fold hydrolase [Sinimarinibacterium sp. CAU 1509]TJY59810.1 alpha/beta fold hydrolase [Sinimarinibacterium sp. CAU 1509]